MKIFITAFSCFIVGIVIGWQGGFHVRDEEVAAYATNGWTWLNVCDQQSEAFDFGTCVRAEYEGNTSSAIIQVSNGRPEIYHH